MPEITPYTNLKSAIAVLEKKQAESRQLLQEQFKVTYEGLDPFNFLKSSFSNIAGSPEVRNNLLAIILPLITGLISKRAAAGTRSPDRIKRAGILLLDGLNRYISQNPEVIRNISHLILNLFKRKKTTEEPEEQ